MESEPHQSTPRGQGSGDSQPDGRETIDLVTNRQPGHIFGTTTIGGSGSPLVIEGNVHHVYYNFPPSAQPVERVRTSEDPYRYGNTQPLDRRRTKSTPDGPNTRAQVGAALRSEAQRISRQTIPAPAFHRGTGARQSVNEENANSEAWVEILLLQALYVKLTKFKVDGKSNALREWTLCAISLESQAQQLEQYPLRRLRILDSNPVSLWLPQTRVRLFCHGTHIDLQFSDCNKLEASGQFPTKDGRRKSIATYNPDDPNVHLHLQFADDNDTNKFKEHVLCPAESLTLRERKPHIFSYCTFFHQAPDSTSDQHRVMMWVRRKDSEKAQYYEEHDEICFTDRIDIQAYYNNASLTLVLGHLNWRQYHPDDHRPDLPWAVPQTSDGRPAKTSISGGELRTSTLRLPTKLHEIVRLLNMTIAECSLWQCKAIFDQVWMKARSAASTWSKILHRENETLVQLTIWESQAKLKMLMRVHPHNDDDRGESEKRWSVVSLARSQLCHSNVLEEKDPGTFTIKNVQCVQGAYLTTRDLSPDDGQSNLPTPAKDLVHLTISFRDLDEWERFRLVVGTECFPWGEGDQ